MENEPALTTGDLEEPLNSSPESETNMDFEDAASTGYALTFNDTRDHLELYKKGILVGKGRKYAAGVYLITADSFTGIGFMEGGNFIIEYDVNGSTQRVVLTK